MVQRLLTKYGLAVHIACVCLFPLWFLGQPRVSGLVPLLWLSLAAAEWMILIPSVRRGETLADARRRVARAFWWDPFLYVGIAVVGLVGMQSLNSGCELVYLPDADVWQLSKPPVPWAPFSVERGAAFTQLAVFTACLTAGVVLRVAVGKGAKRVLLQLLSGVSGAFALVCAGLAFQGREPWAALASGAEASAAGVYFGFWLLLGMGLLAEALARGQRGCALLFVTGCLGNLLGLLCFASPLALSVCAVVAGLLFFYWLVYLAPLVSRTTQFMLFLCTVACVSVVVAGLVLFPRNPVTAKLEAAWPVAQYWSALSARNDVRSKAAMTAWQEHPWVGVGAGGFYHFVGLAVKPDEWRAVEKDRACVYNDGIQFLCEYGVFGAGLLFAALVTLLIPVCYRARLMGWHQTRGAGPDRPFLLRLSPVVLSGGLATVLCCLEGFVASPFRSAAVLLSWTCVLASMPAFLPEKEVR
jgi:hypothetical protein